MNVCCCAGAEGEEITKLDAQPQNAAQDLLGAGQDEVREQEAEPEALAAKPEEEEPPAPAGEAEVVLATSTAVVAQEEKTGRPRLVEVRIQKASEEEELGAGLDNADGKTFVIDRIYRGLLANCWNSREEKQIFPGDKIVAVNGATGGAMLSHLTNDMNLTLDVVQPKVLEIMMVKGAQGIGLDLGLFPRRKTVAIRSLMNGALRDWSKAKGQDIAIGDRIVSVNGVTDSAEAIAEAISSVPEGKLVEMVIWHYG